MEYTVIAKEDLATTDGQTWTKGLDYKVIDRKDYFILTSDPGSVNIRNTVKDKALEHFHKVDITTEYDRGYLQGRIEEAKCELYTLHEILRQETHEVDDSSALITGIHNVGAFLQEHGVDPTDCH